ncbi:unnamed protein product [Aphanomyces euteiches]|uniref:Uncharacterized protein n=1 Tax=Aphanomyces euteiches TaxID=100861 RepID=A0A6G0XAT0_9STRA|nr:hypothetical protein Ae201684_006399 [Aphanomyces euteiches]KAH9091003.1 hypothetical protein Ae201684P_006404 [Aphanomyces euteiches]KAH9146443.1 hypothetical protein AeRB84_009703 [Aphanomyces euteiches]
MGNGGSKDSLPPPVYTNLGDNEVTNAPPGTMPDYLDKPPVRRESSLRRVSSASFLLKTEAPMEPTPGYTLSDDELKKIQRAGDDVESNDDEESDDDEEETLRERRPAREGTNLRLLSVAEEEDITAMQLPAAKYVLQPKKSTLAQTIVKPSSGLVGIQPGSLAIADDEDPDAKKQRRIVEFSGE